MSSTKTESENAIEVTAAPSNAEDYDTVVKTAAHLSMIEIVIGSFVHGFKLPLGGHFLSLNQGFFLCRQVSRASGRIYNARQSIETSGIAATLKSLSPAGNKIGPMLSIAVQGVLFSIGLICFGSKKTGQITGLILLSAWAFIQPLITLFIIYGFEVVKVFSYYFERMQKDLPQVAQSIGLVIAFFMILKALLAGSIPFLLSAVGKEKMDAFEEKLLHQTSKIKYDRKKHLSTWAGVFYDLTRPLFLLSMFLVFSFFYLTESNSVKLFWLCLRPIGIAFLLFYFVRAQWFLSFLQKMALKSNFFFQIHKKTQLTQKYIDEKMNSTKSL